jgi:hypothetical protein
VISPLEPGRYSSAAAFRAALEARLRQAAGGEPRRLNLMRVQFAIGRLLVRLELTQPGEWIAKDDMRSVDAGSGVRWGLPSSDASLA